MFSQLQVGLIIENRKARGWTRDAPDSVSTASICLPRFIPTKTAKTDRYIDFATKDVHIEETYNFVLGSNASEFGVNSYSTIHTRAGNSPALPMPTLS